MKRTICCVAFLISGGMGLSGSAWAQQASSNSDNAGIQLLAQQYVDAINHKSVNEQKAILHPKSRACIRPQTQPYFDGIFSRRMENDIPDGYVVRTEERSPEYFSPPETIEEYPVRPTRILQIEYFTGATRSAAIVLAIVKDGSKWVQVLPCPSPEAVKRILAEQAEAKAWHQRVQQLVSDLADPLRSEIETLLKKGQRFDAARKYQEASGEDLAVAVSVIDSLVSRK
jgi:hypothetical protein